MVAVYRSRREITVLRESEALDGQDVLPGSRLSVAEIF